ncbi:NucA/NucB deoxyribonuclease domain-containing protein [Nonomuraea sp. NPDC049141]|uniref:NucA/NucB deoxyribonuclease domain-containing protein n=1 Tax=Nonomuraea sp. NPDC049141 TaxID=3155500 RepID=UPI0033D6A673
MKDGGPVPGEPGGVPLTRGSKDDANRDKACPRSLPRPPGDLDSCDEYPFNSTGEGAASEKGVSCRMIDKAQNSKGGTELNLFYQNPPRPEDRQPRRSRGEGRPVLHPDHR